MIDKAILIVSSVTFLLFVVSLALWVRRFGQKGVLSAMKRLFMLLSLVSSFVLWLTISNFRIEIKAMSVIVHLLLFGSLSFAYILGLFGMPLTSLRIALLLTLASYGSKGASLKKLLKTYSKYTVMRHRIQRLETSGEIIRKGNSFMLRSRQSYFVLHNQILLFLIKLYSPIKPGVYPK